MTPVDTAGRVLRRDWRARREIITPEGVPLNVELAEFSERAVALIIDLAILLLCALTVLLLFVFTAWTGVGRAVFLTILLFVVLLFRVVYFIHFELSGNGATPGKRIVGIRVADRGGGPLVPSAVIARNLTREIEIFIPASLLISTPGAGTGTPWQYLLLIGWLACFAVLLFFNRDRMRAGDLIAGTLVIAVPRQRLLADLVEARARFVFTDHQLGAYGARELQVLEEVLRRPDGMERAALLHDILDRICRKIEWRDAIAPADTEPFLRDFYTAQRAYLEREQLFGRPRADKFQIPVKRQ